MRADGLHVVADDVVAALIKDVEAKRAEAEAAAKKAKAESTDKP